MRVRFVKDRDRNQVKFVLSEVETVYEDVLRAHYYTKEADGFVKSFPADAEDLDLIQANFRAGIGEMLAQLAGLAPVRWEEAVQEISRRLTGAVITWWLTGSCAACLWGAAIDPHDVDVMLDSGDLGRVHRLLRETIIEPVVSCRGWVTNHFGVAFHGARIDLAFNPQPCLDRPEPSDSGPFAREHLETVRFRGHEIRVPPLRLQLANNLRRGRLDRAKAIEAVISAGGR